MENLISTIDLCLKNIESKQTNSLLWRVNPEMCFINVPFQSEPYFEDLVWISVKEIGVLVAEETYELNPEQLQHELESFIDHQENLIDAYYSQF